MYKMVSCAMIGLFLAACDTPSARYSDINATRMSVGGSVFDIRLRGRRAEAIRINARYAPNRYGIAQEVTLAIETVSGCDVVALDGDQAMITARLDCGSGAPAPRPRYPALDCEIDYVIDGFGEMTCFPV